MQVMRPAQPGDMRMDVDNLPLARPERLRLIGLHAGDVQGPQRIADRRNHENHGGFANGYSVHIRPGEARSGDPNPL